MLEVFSNELETASREVNEAKIMYAYSHYQLDQAWKKHNLFADEDPRFLDPDCPEEDFRKFLDQLAILLEIALDWEAEKKAAYLRMDAAKVNLLNLLED